MGRSAWKQITILYGMNRILAQNLPQSLICEGSNTLSASQKTLFSQHLRVLQLLFTYFNQISLAWLGLIQILQSNNKSNLTTNYNSDFHY